VNNNHSCLKCDELAIQLEETRKELSSSQLIIRLLYNEINDITSAKSFKPINTNCECETGNEVNSTNKWSDIASKQMYKVRKASDFHTYKITQAIENVNRYSRLANLSEVDNCRDQKETSKIMKITKVPHIPINNYVKRKEHGKIKNPAATLQPRNTIRQQTSNHQEGKDESMKDQMSSYIPTVVNGQVNPSKSVNHINITNNNQEPVQNLLKESTVQLINKGKYSKCGRHKVLVMGDSHMRGCVAKRCASLDARFDVCGAVKPGSLTGSLMETLKSEVEKL
jgi:hypothetical protein